jgi:hypothetical protein
VSTTLNARLARLEKNCPGLKPGPERMTDEELAGVIGVLRQMEADEAIAPDRLEWAAAICPGKGCCRRGHPLPPYPSTALAHWLLSILRHHGVSTKRSMAIVAPAQTPNGTGPNHIITGSGPPPHFTRMIADLGSRSVAPVHESPATGRSTSFTLKLITHEWPAWFVTEH